MSTMQGTSNEQVLDSCLNNTKKSTYRHIGNSTLEIIDDDTRKQILSAIMSIGCYSVTNNEMRRFNHKFASTLSSVIRGRKKYHSKRCRALFEPNGLAVLILFLRLKNNPWCVIVHKKIRNGNIYPKMFLMRCRMTDDKLFDGTVLDGTLIDDHETIYCKDVSVLRGRVVFADDFRKRIDIVSDVLNQHYAFNVVTDNYKLSVANWKTYDDMTELCHTDNDCGGDKWQLFIVTPDDCMWRTPITAY